MHSKQSQLHLFELQPLQDVTRLHLCQIVHAQLSETVYVCVQRCGSGSCDTDTSKTQATNLMSCNWTFSLSAWICDLICTLALWLKTTSPTHGCAPCLLNVFLVVLQSHKIIFYFHQWKSHLCNQYIHEHLSLCSETGRTVCTDWLKTATDGETNMFISVCVCAHTVFLSDGEWNKLWQSHSVYWVSFLDSLITLLIALKWQPHLVKNFREFHFFRGHSFTVAVTFYEPMANISNMHKLNNPF